jgi:hypothetical protein
MASFLESRVQLRQHAAARVSAPGAVLPLAADDPHPATTLALHRLWATLRLNVSLAEGGEPSVVPSSPNQTPLQILEVLAPLLVRLPSCLSFK